MMPAEERIWFVVENRELRTGFFQEGVQITAASAIHQFNRQFHFRTANRVEIDELLDLFKVSRLWIERFALISAHDRALDLPTGGLAAGDAGFDPFGHLGWSGCAVRGGEFQTLIFR